MIIASRSGQPHIRFVGGAYRLDILIVRHVHHHLVKRERFELNFVVAQNRILLVL